MFKKENIPNYLKEHGKFCLWKYVQYPGDKKPRKIPYNPSTNKEAKSNDSSTFVSLALAIEAAEGYDGLGLGLFDGLIGIDIDDCIDQEGNISPLAQDILSQVNTYAEKSPSGTGIHLIGLSPGFSYDTSKYYLKNPKSQVEIYAADMTNRYLTITGNALNSKSVNDIKEVLPRILDLYMTRPKNDRSKDKPIENKINLFDFEVIEKAKASKTGDKFSKLWEGDYSEYPSQSEADQALCNILAFYTQGDKSRIDYLFRQSRLYREKWEREDYREETLKKAAEGCKEYYNPVAQTTHHNVCTKDFVTTPKKMFKTWNAEELRQADIPKPYFSVEGIVPQGLTVIASPPKFGKTWLGLDMCISVASGSDFLGHKTNQGKTLYMDLETYEGAMKERTNLITNNTPLPQGFEMVFKDDVLSLKDGLIEQLDEYLKNTPGLNLIVIDILQKVKYPTTKNENVYDTDYRTGQELGRWGQANKVCVVAITHTSKFKHDDVLANVTGSNGVTGSADSVLVLQKDDRFKNEATLSVMCRYAEQNQYNLVFDKFKWHNTGCVDEETAAIFERRKIETIFAESDTRKKLVRFMGNKTEWKGRPGTLREEALKQGISFADTPQKMGSFLAAQDNIDKFYSLDGLQIDVISNGSGSKLYHIKKLSQNNTVDFVAAPNNNPFDDR